MVRILLWLMLFVTGTSFAMPISLPGGTLTIPGVSTTGTSFIYPGTLSQTDTITFEQTGNPCMQVQGGFCTNGAGVLIVAGTVGVSPPVGGSATFTGPAGVIPAGTWTYGSLLMTISGVGTIQVFPTTPSNGLGSPTPPASLNLPTTSLAALGFPNFSQINPTITFIVADTGFEDNSGSFLLTQNAPVATAVPTLGEWGTIGLGMLLAGLGVATLRRRQATHRTPTCEKSAPSSDRARNARAL